MDCPLIIPISLESSNAKRLNQIQGNKELRHFGLRKPAETQKTPNLRGIFKFGIMSFGTATALKAPKKALHGWDDLS